MADASVARLNHAVVPTPRIPADRCPRGHLPAVPAGIGDDDRVDLRGGAVGAGVPDRVDRADLFDDALVFGGVEPGVVERRDLDEALQGETDRPVGGGLQFDRHLVAAGEPGVGRSGEGQWSIAARLGRGQQVVEVIGSGITQGDDRHVVEAFDRCQQRSWS